MNLKEITRKIEAILEKYNFETPYIGESAPQYLSKILNCLIYLDNLQENKNKKEESKA